MDEKERDELNKQKQLLDCISYINSALESFERLEEYKADILPIVDGFDLNHSDTYLKLTENIRRELFYIKSFSEYAASLLTKYRRLCNPESDIYSVKEKKQQQKYGIQPLRDVKKQVERSLNDSQRMLDEMLFKQKERQRQSDWQKQQLNEIQAKINQKKENTDRIHFTDYAQLLVKYQPKVIKSEAEKDHFIASVTKLEQKANRTSEEDNILELLVTLIEKFESKK